MKLILIFVTVYIFSGGLLLGSYLEHRYMTGEISQRNSCIDLFNHSSSWRYTLCNLPMDSKK